jgi:hypothetical protein
LKSHRAFEVSPQAFSEAQTQQPEFLLMENKSSYWNFKLLAIIQDPILSAEATI